VNAGSNVAIVAAYVARRVASRRKTLLLVALASTPALIGLVVRRFGGPPSVDPYFRTAPIFYAVFLCQIMPLFLAGSVVRDAIEDGEAAFFLTTPTSRAAYVLGSWLGLAAPLAALFLGSITGCVVAWRGGFGGGIDAATIGEAFALFGVSMIGAMLYAGLFTWIGLVTKWPTVIGVAYYGIVDAFIGSLPGPPRRAALSAYLEALLPRRFEGRAVLLAEAQPGVDTPIDPWTARVVLLVAAATIVFLLVRSARRRDFADVDG
jgi:hypothetical protein